ncbi:MAG: PilZ domain-containing protein [Desulfobacterales bacterium]|jgi:Tfp pilus assembly protein PilZ|nr:PilZ domain-containing protein [Desulfobacterales bacterium]
MEKRQCNRFSIPGTTLFYKKKSKFWKTRDYSDEYYPVLDLSLGGLKFLSHHRIDVGEALILKLNIPGIEQQPEIKAAVRWASKNREKSYQYQMGVSFNPYGQGEKENPTEILTLLKTLETNAAPLF